VVVVSQDLDELMEISDRFAGAERGAAVRRRGPARGLSVEEIGLMLGRRHGMEVAHVH
jgi:simple sugar transport system ATP-binding protein